MEIMENMDNVAVYGKYISSTYKHNQGNWVFLKLKFKQNIKFLRLQCLQRLQFFFSVLYMVSWKWLKGRHKAPLFKRKKTISRTEKGKYWA